MSFECAHKDDIIINTFETLFKISFKFFRAILRRLKQILSGFNFVFARNIFHKI